MKNTVSHTYLKQCLCNSECWLGIRIVRKFSDIINFSVEYVSPSAPKCSVGKETVPVVFWWAFSARRDFGWLTVQLLPNVLLGGRALVEIRSSASCQMGSGDPKEPQLRFWLYLAGGPLWSWDSKTRKSKKLLP